MFAYFVDCFSDVERYFGFCFDCLFGVWWFWYFIWGIGFDDFVCFPYGLGFTCFELGLSLRWACLVIGLDVNVCFDWSGLSFNLCYWFAVFVVLISFVVCL